MSIIIPKLSESEAAKMDRIYRFSLSRNEIKKFNYMLRARRIKAMWDKFEPEKFSPLGENVANIDLHTYIMWNNSHQGCWDDAEFVREFVRDNPECRGVKVPKKVFNGVKL